MKCERCGGFSSPRIYEDAYRAGWNDAIQELLQFATRRHDAKNNWWIEYLQHIAAEMYKEARDDSD